MSMNLIHRLQTWSSKQVFILFAAFLVYVLADGATFSFGLYVDELITEYSKTKSKTVLRTSTIAAMTQSIPLLLSPIVCRWTTKFGASSASLIGCIVSAIGYSLPFILQFYKTFWIPAIGYGCLLSIGLAFCYVPAYLTLPFYFEDDRGTATGLAVSGSGVGQVLLSVLVKACILEYGWRGASLITGGLFFFMIIAVLAFRTPSTSDLSSVTQPETELRENLVHSSIAVAIEDTEPREEISIDRPSSRRSRGMTIAQVLPLLISSVPVRAGVTMPPTEPSTNRRHSLNIRPRNFTVCTEPSTRQTTTFVPTTDFRRKRAKTIAVPPSTTQKWSGSLERIRPPPLAPIASAEESSDEEQHSSSSLSSSQLPSLPSVRLPPVEQMDLLDEPVNEQHWLLNYRFLLFCFSNFALCLVMGAPYVIFPKYISETFQNQGYLASWTLSNMGIASGVGQILLGYLHDRKIFSAWIMYTFSVIISGASLVILALFRYKAVVLICAFMYGLAISANYALQVLIVIDAISMEKMTNGFGILQFCQGVSTLIGIPIQGLLRDVSHTYKLSFLTSGFIIIISGLIMFLWPCLKAKKPTRVDNGQE
ncbi:unnamed protein product [Adineta ricciae]|uniref:Major facilitator superfamily (MFS) profile domain-containing protein n=1 Tax=Adineta ricciae TaxID=249248 RepID=A0A813W011_ADIRI|nr:unnamed protein product [Adineta ricciae]CAF0975536.1 unnamed protein product [Adineta ricciae]